MTRERFEQLLDRLLDNELTAGEGAELGLALRVDPKLRQSLRQELVLWELWSQQQAPERSGEAFVAGLGTRLRAERHSEPFVADVTRLIRDGDEVAADKSPRPWERAWAAVRGWWRRWFQPSGWLWTVASASVVLAVLWLSWPQTAQATAVVHGEAVCTACGLHEGHDHLPAIRVRDGSHTTIYYVQPADAKLWKLGNFCVRPIPVVATGATRVEGGRHVLTVESAGRDPAADPDPKR